MGLRFKMEKGKKLNWNKIKKGVFLVNTLGIIFDPSKRMILIGRRENDPYIKQLSWCFPSGSPVYNDDLEKGFEKIIKKKTGLRVKSLGPVFSRILKENNRFLFVYYLCEVVGGKPYPADDIVELKWIKPKDLQKHFTTSFDKRLKEYIIHLK